jgi:hypothetical protein
MGYYLTVSKIHPYKVYCVQHIDTLETLTLLYTISMLIVSSSITLDFVRTIISITIMVVNAFFMVQLTKLIFSGSIMKLKSCIYPFEKGGVNSFRIFFLWKKVRKGVFNRPNVS